MRWDIISLLFTCLCFSFSSGTTTQYFKNTGYRELNYILRDDALVAILRYTISKQIMVAVLSGEALRVCAT